MKINIYIVLLILIPNLVISQDKEWEKNQKNIESLIFDVVGNKELKLNPANRFFDPVPPQSVTRTERSLSYDFREMMYNGSVANITLRPRMLAAEVEEKLYSGYVKGGFGNYVTPFFDAYIASKREKEFGYGAILYYDYSFKGAVDEKNSADGNWGASLYANAYGDKVSLYSDLAFSRQWLHFYGYPENTPVDPEDIEQGFNRVRFSLSAANTNRNQDFRFNLKAGLLNQSDMFKAGETSFFTDISTTTEVIENVFVDVDGGYRLITRTDTDVETTRNNIYVNGRARFSKENMDITAGVELGYNPDTLAGKKGVRLFPKASIRYIISPDLVVFGELDGGIQVNSWMNATLDNPFINQSQYISNTINVTTLKGGLLGKLSYYLSYEAGAAYMQNENSLFFINDDSDISRFNVAYDKGRVNLFNPYLSLKFNKNEIYRFALRGDYYNYQMSQLEEAFHKPTYKIGLTGGVKVGDKIKFNTRLDVLGGIKYIENDVVSELDPIIDLGLGAEYFVNNRFSAFLNTDNVISKNYQLYYRYPVRGIQVNGGVVFRF